MASAPANDAVDSARPSAYDTPPHARANSAISAG